MTEKPVLTELVERKIQTIGGTFTITEGLDSKDYEYISSQNPDGSNKIRVKYWKPASNKNPLGIEFITSSNRAERGENNTVNAVDAEFSRSLEIKKERIIELLELVRNTENEHNWEMWLDETIIRKHFSKLPVDTQRELLLSLARECGFTLTDASLPVKDASPSTTPEQVTRAKQQARLAGLRLRYQEMSESIALPPTGFESEEQRKAASALASAFHDIHELERKLGYELTTIDPILREANRLKKADQRAKTQNANRKSVKPIASTQPR